jgi:hypothetical protein
MLATPYRKMKGLVMRRPGTPSVFCTRRNVAEKELAVHERELVAVHRVRLSTHSIHDNTNFFVCISVSALAFFICSLLPLAGYLVGDFSFATMDCKLGWSLATAIRKAVFFLVAFEAHNLEIFDLLFALRPFSASN